MNVTRDGKKTHCSPPFLYTEVFIIGDQVRRRPHLPRRAQNLHFDVNGPVDHKKCETLDFTWLEVWDSPLRLVHQHRGKQLPVLVSKQQISKLAALLVCTHAVRPRHGGVCGVQIDEFVISHATQSFRIPSGGIVAEAGNHTTLTAAQLFSGKVSSVKGVRSLSMLVVNNKTFFCREDVRYCRALCGITFKTFTLQSGMRKPNNTHFWENVRRTSILGSRSQVIISNEV